MTPRLALAAVFMVFAAAGLSSVHADDYCHNAAGRGTLVSSSVVLWPPGMKCTYARPGGGEVTRESGSVLGFLAILAAGLVYVFARRSDRSIVVACVFGVAGLAQVPLGIVPAIGFGWFVGGYIGFSLTRSRSETLVAIGALGAGALLELLGAGPAGWVVILLALIAFTPTAEVRPRTAVSH